MNPILFLADLDHNLFQSLRVDPDGVYPMTVNKNGEPHCYATVQQAALFDLMSEGSFCVAITARTAEQMQRVTGWSTKQMHDLVLCDLGMTLLYRFDNGPWSEIEAWSSGYLESARQVSQVASVDFDQFKTGLQAYLNTDEKPVLSCSMNNCYQSDDVPFYFLATMKDKNGGSEAQTAAVRHFCQAFMDARPGRYFYHESEGTFSLWPTYVGKELAASRLIEAFHQGFDDDRFMAAKAEMGSIDLIITSGDSLSDMPFMHKGDFWLSPTRSQITDLVSPPRDKPFSTHHYKVK